MEYLGAIIELFKWVMEYLGAIIELFKWVMEYLGAIIELFKWVMVYLGAIMELFNWVGPPVGKYVEYHRKLKDNMTNLRKELRDLNSQKEDVELKLRGEQNPGNLPSSEVNNWLGDVETVKREVEAIEKEVERKKFFSRSGLSKLAEEKIQEVKGYQQKGNSFKSLVIDAPPTGGIIIPTTSLAGKNTQQILEEIWKYLMGDEVSKIGVFGIGGVGKTTILTHTNNRLLENKDKFAHVIWVTVSQPFDLTGLQDQIASRFEKSIKETADQKVRAGELSRLLQGKKFVLLLDDMWEGFELEEIGIPEPTKKNGCKLLITTRSRDVCRFMGCKEVHMQPLSNDEALKLFLEKLELDISQVPTLKEVVQLVAEQCAGLPLAIITVAGCMRRIDDLQEWRNALNELSNCIRSEKDLPVITRLQFSYDRLANKNVQHCFLYCALYPEDFKIPKDELIDYWIFEGLVGEMDTMQARYDKGHSILKRLLDNCLLESAGSGKHVKMHDLMREMALHVTSKSPLFMTKTGLKLGKIPSEGEWKEKLEKVSLMSNDIEEIPSDMSPNCPFLSTLLLRSNPLQSIPESFFANMQGLNILDLSFTYLEKLPNSIFELRNLTALLLKRCRRLQHVPSLAKLLSLQNLNLEDTKIKEAPEGIEMLVNLRYLNLNSSNLRKLPAGMLSKLIRLQKLGLYFGLETSAEIIGGVRKLKELETFEGHFRKSVDFTLYVKSLSGQCQTPKNYRFLVGQPLPQTILLSLFIFKKAPDVDKYSFLHIDKYLKLSCLEGEDYVVIPKDIQSLVMTGCNYEGSLSDVLLFNRASGEGGLNNIYADLKALILYKCHNLKKLLSPTLLQALPNLELIDVTFCKRIEEIVTLNVDEEEEEKGISNTITFTLPKLRNLTLSQLPQLKRLCSSHGVMVCNSLQEIDIWRCPKLKRLPLSLPLLHNGQPSPPLAIQKIKIRRRLWESLEWDDPNAKNLLQPYCGFSTY